MWKKVKKQVKKLCTDENGVTTLEWVMLGIFLVVALIGTVTSVKGTLGSTMTSISSKLSGSN